MTSRLRLFCKQQVLFKRIKQEIFDPEIETVLHPSVFRFKMLGYLTVFGQLIFWFVWAVWMPQPYENMYVRLTLVLLGVGIFFETTKYGEAHKGAHKYSYAVYTLQLPIFFTWMFWMNHGNAVWLASMAAMVLIYYHFTD